VRQKGPRKMGIEKCSQGFHSEDEVVLPREMQQSGLGGHLLHPISIAFLRTKSHVCWLRYQPFRDNSGTPSLVESLSCIK
jgi:hypothetical protein